MKLALIFDQNRPDTLGNYFLGACQALGLEYVHYPLSAVSEIPAKHDWYLRIDHGDDYAIDWPKSLRPASFYAIDTHLSHSWKKIRRVADDYDSVFCCHRQAAEALRSAEWIPVGCDPKIHAPVDGSQQWDIGFVGTEGAIPRKFYLQALRERYPSNHIGAADYRQIGQVYANSRIGFNYSIENDVNMRMFEVMAARSCLLTNALGHDDMERLGLREGEHFVTYRRGRDLYEQIDRLLDDPARRTRIAQAAQASVTCAHTYAHRLKRMLWLSAQRFGWNSLPLT
jgi:hypothetical protein